MDGAVRMATRLAVFPRVLVLSAVIDLRRSASWLAAVTAAVGLFLLQRVTADLVLPLAWAHGAVVAVVAAGDLPVRRAAGRSDGPAAMVSLAWAVERMVWPLLGTLIVSAWGAGASAAWLLASGCVAASLLGLACRWLRCSASDAASGTLAVTLLASLAAMAVPPSVRSGAEGLPIIAGIWSVLAAGLLAMVAQADRRSCLPREATTGGGPLGDSELRRWYLRLMMVGSLLGMVRWLFVAEPLVGLYGVASGLLVASLVLPDAALPHAGASCRCWTPLAQVAGRRPSFWRPLQPWLLPAVVAVWPLLVAMVLVPAARGLPAVLAIVASAAVVGLGSLARLAVARGWLSRETAFAAAAALVWFLCLSF